jgi:hypothetical protein
MLLRFAAVPALLAALVPAAAVQSQRSIIVTVLDQSGAPVKDVTAGDLAVQEDSSMREVTDVKPAGDPMTVAMLIDNTKPIVGMESPTRELRAGLTKFVQTIQQANPASAIGIWEFAGAGVMIQKPTTKTEDLTKRISRMFPSQQSGGVMLEALVDASKELSKKGVGPRRVILSVSFGSQEVSTMQPQDVANAMRKAGVNYWAVTIVANQDAVSNSGGGSALRDVIIDNVTAASGGAKVSGVTGISLESQLGKIADALVSQYVVTYARPAGASDAPQTIMAVSKKGLKALTGPWVQ